MKTALSVLLGVSGGFLVVWVFDFAFFLLPSQRAVSLQKRVAKECVIPDEDLGEALSVPCDLTMDWRKLPGRKLPWSLRHIPFPGQHRIGYRGNPGEVSQPVDIAVLGDSHVYGLEVSQDETCVSQLGRLSGLRTANLALPFQGTTQSVKLYELYGDRLRPKVALLMVCPNDPWDNNNFQAWRRGGGAARDHARTKKSFFTSLKRLKVLRLKSAFILDSLIEYCLT